MRLKAVARLVLLLFLAASLTMPAAKTWRREKGFRTVFPENSSDPFSTSSGVAVYYAHGAFRCRACDNLAEFAREAVSGFPRELAERRLAWRVVDYEAPGNQWFADRYKLPGPSVVLVRYRGGKPVRWEVLQAAWELLHDRPAAVAYLRREIRGWLEAN
jgi:hypothetical protein